VLCFVACQRFFFPVGKGFFPYFCAPRIPTRMRNTPRGSPALPATEDILAKTSPTGATPPANVGTRTPAARHQHTRSPPRSKHPPPVSPTPATGHSTLVPSLARPPPPTRRANAGHTDAGGNPPRTMPAPSTPRRSCRRRRRSRNKWTPRSPARAPKHAEPPPAIPTPAAARPATWPPRARAAGLADTGGGAVTSARLPCPRRPQRAVPPPAIPTPAATRPAKWPPPAAQSPAATHQRPSPPNTPAAGLATSGGGPVAASCVP